MNSRFSEHLRPFSLLNILILFMGLISCKGQKSLNTEHLKEMPTKQRASDVLRVKSYGKSGETLILIHGLGSSAKAWNKLLPYLIDDYIVYTLDLPKYLNTEDKSLVTIDNYANLLLKFIQELNIDNIHIVGHSMGGQIALKLAIDNPSLIATMALLAPAGFEQFSATDKKWFETWVTKEFYLSQTDIAIKRSFDINFYNSKLPDDATFMLEERLKLKLDSAKYSRYLDYVIASVNSMLEQTVYMNFYQLHSPTVVLFGKQDQLIPNKILHPQLSVEDVLNLADQIPHCEKYMIEDAGHFIQWDQPLQVAHYLRSFINKN